MKTPNDLWDDLGSISEDELLHVITKLFGVYESRLERDPQDQEALTFFKHPENALTQTMECNFNRR